MPAEATSRPQRPPREAALETLAVSAATNIPGVDFVSISVQHQGQPMQTVAATDPLAERTDHLQYQLREGPSYAAVTDQRFILVNDLAAAVEFALRTQGSRARSGSPSRYSAPPQRGPGGAQPVCPHRRGVRPFHGTDR